MEAQSLQVGQQFGVLQVIDYRARARCEASFDGGLDRETAFDGVFGQQTTFAALMDKKLASADAEFTSPIVAV